MLSPSFDLTRGEGDRRTTLGPAWKVSPPEVRPDRRPVSDYDTRPLILRRKEGGQTA